MGKVRSWTDEQLIEVLARAYSYRAVLLGLHLVPAGGNYMQVKRRVQELSLSTTHFKGKAWNAGLRMPSVERRPLEELLVKNGSSQSHRLKLRLFEASLKRPMCELCGWAKRSPDGRMPLELDHINGDHSDNRLENLRILCPNCHSLQPTHRGRNKKVRYARVV